MRPLLPLLLALAPLAASLALAQAATEEPTFLLTLDPPRVKMAPGRSFDVGVVLHNGGNETLVLALAAKPENATVMKATLAQDTLEVPPQGSARVVMRVEALAGAPEGTQAIAVHASDARATAATPARVGAVLHVQVAAAATVPSALAEHAALALTLPKRAEVAAGGEASVEVRVTNLLPREVLVNLRAASLDSAVSGTFSPSQVRLRPNGTAVVTLALHADESAAVGATGLEVVARLADEPRSAPAARKLEVLVHAPAPAAASDEAAPLEVPPLAWAVAGTAAATGAVAVFVASFRRGGFAFALLAPLYTRIARNSVLEHPLRTRLAETVKEHPGVSFGELQRRLDIAAGQLTHHARVLEDAGVVFSTPHGQERRFFHVGQPRATPLLPLGERALVELQRAGPRGLSELARDLGVTRQALHYHVRKLAAEGRVEVAPDGRVTPLISLVSRTPPPQDAD